MGAGIVVKLLKRVPGHVWARLGHTLDSLGGLFRFSTNSAVRYLGKTSDGLLRISRDGVEYTLKHTDSGKVTIAAVNGGEVPEDLVVALQRVILNTGRGMRNPFANKSAAEIEQMFLKKGFVPTGKNPVGGYGGYVDPQTGRSYHIDPTEFGRYRELNHIDINRLKTYRGRLTKRKMEYLSTMPDGF